MTHQAALVPVLALAQSWVAMATERAALEGLTPTSRLKVRLDCDAELEPLFRSALDFVDFVDAEEADVLVHVTDESSHGSIRRCAVTFTGMGPFAGIEAAVHLGGIRGRALWSPSRRSAMQAGLSHPLLAWVP